MLDQHGRIAIGSTPRLDIRGHGQSIKPSAGAYSLRHTADDAAAFLAALGLHRPGLMGHSWGSQSCCKVHRSSQYASVFSFHWESKTYNYGADNEYRKAQAARYIDEVFDETADDWYRLIHRCAATQSNDTATFPLFGEFLQQLARTRPHIVFAFAQRNDSNVLTFLPAILNGLYESQARNTYAELIEDYLAHNAYLPAIARHCRLVKKDVANTVKRVLSGAIAVDEGMAVSECLIFVMLIWQSLRFGSGIGLTILCFVLWAASCCKPFFQHSRMNWRAASFR